MLKFGIAALVGKALNSFTLSKEGKDLGVTNDITNAIAAYLKNNAELEKEIIAEIDKARQHDITIGQNVSKFIINLRGLIRPVCTIAAFTWYIYAKLNNIELTSEDYSIIGGVLAFWFGFRSYDKKRLF
tara:strand:- start:2946 stop:3332 length:387 start_codon:yes stop_codon:yes gene_type:complete